MNEFADDHMCSRVLLDCIEELVSIRNFTITGKMNDVARLMGGIELCEHVNDFISTTMMMIHHSN